MDEGCGVLDSARLKADTGGGRRSVSAAGW
jgi:hypothetical protein